MRQDVHVTYDYDDGWLVEVQLEDGEWELAWHHYNVERPGSYDFPFTRQEAREMAREVRRQMAGRAPAGGPTPT